MHLWTKNGPAKNGAAVLPPDEKLSDALSDHVSQTIDTIAVLHAQTEKGVGFHQRAIESVTAFLGRPLFLTLALLLVFGWIVANVFAHHLGLREIDPPPFSWLQGVVGLGALLLTIVVLITQNRQARIAERRAQLDLQVNLLAEQKIAKLIGLVEELRRDLPTVRDRHDPEAEAMKEAADPQAVLAALEERLEEKLEEKLEETLEAAAGV